MNTQSTEKDDPRESPDDPDRTSKSEGKKAYSSHSKDPSRNNQKGAASENENGGGAINSGEKQDDREAAPWSRDDINGKIDSFQEAVKTSANAKKTVEFGKKSYDAAKQALAGNGGSTTEAAADAGNALKEGAEAGKFGSAMRNLNKGLGPAAVVAGSLGIAQGVDKLSNGNIVEGSLDIVGGTGATVSGAATTASAYTSATSVAGVGLSTVAGVGGGVVALADGAGDIYQGIKEKNLEKGVVGGIKAGAGAAMIAGACTGNPFLVAGGAAAYTGALVYENREAIADFGRQACNTAADGIKTGVRATKEFAGNVADKVSEKAAQIKEKTGQLIDSGMQKASEIKDAVLEKAQSVKKAVSENIDKAKENVAAAASSVANAAKGTWSWAASWF
ncbi:MAG: hypothetical protein RDV48_23430 [Candidatus Eremiobacteraeota bacterium]|nr:hypothetical protein [Candidatus Eremiobacteraeota bacterium]